MTLKIIFTTNKNIEKRFSSLFGILLLLTVISMISITPAFAENSEITIGTVEKSGFSQDCVTNGCYTPNTTTVNIGDKVIFSNTDSSGIHTFTAGAVDGFTPSPTGEFDTSILNAGESGEWIPDIVGKVPYYCSLHTWMVGTVTVQEPTNDSKSMGEKVTLEYTSPEKPMIQQNSISDKAIDELEKEMMKEEKMLQEDMQKTTSDDKMMEKNTMAHKEDGGGCLIATAAYGTELAPQVQFLREIRDNTVLSTTSGVAFMTGFNTLYYSFAPVVADMERENPMFQEAVRAFITPMISSLSIMSLSEGGSEAEVLVFGISVIALNLGMYFAAPAIVVWQVRKRIKI